MSSQLSPHPGARWRIPPRSTGTRSQAAIQGLRVRTRLGVAGLIHDGARLVRVLFPQPRAEDLDPGFAEARARIGRVVPDFLRPLARALEGYLSRDQDDPATAVVPLADHALTPFLRAVFEEVRRIPLGSSRSYAEVARAAGSPGAARAVGQAMARNPWPLVVPCHRVVGSGDSLGGYSGGAGLPTKVRLLDREAGLARAAIR
jgi:methylated-DNA-[protein]-cysteine S-methyltransferase